MTIVPGAANSGGVASDQREEHQATSSGYSSIVCAEVDRAPSISDGSPDESTRPQVRLPRCRSRERRVSCASGDAEPRSSNSGHDHQMVTMRRRRSRRT